MAAEVSTGTPRSAAHRSLYGARQRHVSLISAHVHPWVSTDAHPPPLQPPPLPPAAIPGPAGASLSPLRIGVLLVFFVSTTPKWTACLERAEGGGGEGGGSAGQAGGRGRLPVRALYRSHDARAEADVTAHDARRPRRAVGCVRSSHRRSGPPPRPEGRGERSLPPRRGSHSRGVGAGQPQSVYTDGPPPRVQRSPRTSGTPPRVLPWQPKEPREGETTEARNSPPPHPPGSGIHDDPVPIAAERHAHNGLALGLE